MTVSTKDKPKLQQYRKQLFICTGPRCAPEASEALLQSLGAKLKEHGLTEGERRVKRTRSGCFAVCKSGPIVCVQPDGIWYSDVRPEVMDRIIVEHLKEDRPVQEHIFHRGPGVLDKGGSHD
jgi:(2Fe-2S) ferredoxin